MTLMIKWL